MKHFPSFPAHILAMACVTQNMWSLSQTYLLGIQLDSLFIIFSLLLGFLCSSNLFFRRLIIMLYPCSSPLSLFLFFSSANNLDSSSLCPLFACLSFPVFLPLSSTHMCFLSLSFMFATIPQSIPLTLVFSQLLVLSSPFPSSLCLYYFRLFLRR